MQRSTVYAPPQIHESFTRPSLLLGTALVIVDGDGLIKQTDSGGADHGRR